MTINDLPYSLSISFATRTVSSDCNNTLVKILNLLGSSDTALDSALNELSANKPPDLSTSLKVSLEMTPSVCSVSDTSVGRETGKCL